MDESERRAANLKAVGLNLIGRTIVSEFTEEITVLSESREYVVYLKKKKPSGGGVLGPICKKCWYDPDTGTEVCKIIRCPDDAASGGGTIVV